MMRKPLKNKAKKLKLTTLGFTLIELLAVIILLGTIILIVYPNVNNIILDSKTKSLTKTIESLKHAAYMYTVENNVEASSLEKPIYPTELITNGYLKEVPTNPITKEKLTGCILYKWDNNQYQFRYDEECMFDTSYCFDFDSSTGTITGYNYDGLGCKSNIIIPDTIDDVVVQHIGYAAFIDEITYQRCVDDEWDWHEVDPTYIPYDGDGFYYCDIEEAQNENPITSVTLPKNIVTIDDWAFGYNQLTALSLSDLPHLIAIGRYAFYENTINELIMDNLPELTIIATHAFVYNMINTLVLNNLSKLTVIDDYTFSVNQLTNLTINNLPNLISIDRNAFFNNQLTNLTLTILPKLATIGYAAFAHNQLTGLTLSNLPELTAIDEDAFYDNRIDNLTLTNLPKLTTIGDEAFSHNQLINIDLSTLPSLQNLESNPFIFNPLTNVSLSGEHSYYKVVNNALYTKDGKKLVIGTAGMVNSIESTITEIGEDAFVGYNLTNVTLSDLPELAIIGKRAFYYNNLTNLTLSDLPKLHTIDNEAFYYNSLPDLTLSNLPELDKIGYAAFGYNQLTGIILSGLPNLTTIDYNAFYENKLTNLTLANLPSLTSIGWQTFFKNKITKITLSNLPKLITINEGAFRKNSYYSNPNLTEIENLTGKSFNWSNITSSNTSGQIFETGTIIHQNGNIQVVAG